MKANEGANERIYGRTFALRFLVYPCDDICICSQVSLIQTQMPAYGWPTHSHTFCDNDSWRTVTVLAEQGIMIWVELSAELRQNILLPVAQRTAAELRLIAIHHGIQSTTNISRGDLLHFILQQLVLGVSV